MGLQRDIICLASPDHGQRQRERKFHVGLIFIDRYGAKSTETGVPTALGLKTQRHQVGDKLGNQRVFLTPKKLLLS